MQQPLAQRPEPQQLLSLMGPPSSHPTIDASSATVAAPVHPGQQPMQQQFYVPTSGAGGYSMPGYPQSPSQQLVMQQPGDGSLPGRFAEGEGTPPGAFVDPTSLGLSGSYMPAAPPYDP